MIMYVLHLNYFLSSILVFLLKEIFSIGKSDHAIISTTLQVIYYHGKLKYLHISQLINFIKVNNGISSIN